MSSATARVVLAREALRAARVSRTEGQFFFELEGAGLLVRSRSDPAGTARMTGYAVTLPGLTNRSVQPVWFGGGTLTPALRLGELRARWREGRTGAPPGADMFAGVDAGQIYAHAVAVAQLAAAKIGSARSGRADIAYAVADLLVAAAEATGNPELRRAAEGLNRAARAPWGRSPAASPLGAMLRTASYLLAACAPVHRRTAARRGLIIALVGLAQAVARLRATQQRKLQADAARSAAARLAAVGGLTWGNSRAAFSVGVVARPLNVGRPASAVSRRGLSLVDGSVYPLPAWPTGARVSGSRQPPYRRPAGADPRQPGGPGHLPRPPAVSMTGVSGSRGSGAPPDTATSRRPLRNRGWRAAPATGYPSHAERLLRPRPQRQTASRSAAPAATTESQPSQTPPGAGPRRPGHLNQQPADAKSRREITQGLRGS
jgi:hypothetical protein